MVFSLSALWWMRIRGLWKLPDGRDWLWGNLGLVLMGEAMLSKPLIQFSVDGGSCVPSLVFGLRPNYGRGNAIMETSFKRTYAHTVGFSAPDASGRPLSIHTSARDSQTLTGQSGSVSSGDTAPFSWHTRFCLCPPRVCFPSSAEVL